MNTSPPLRMPAAQPSAPDERLRAPEPGDEGGFDLRKILQALWRGKWIFLLVLTLGLGLTGAYLAATAPLYTARAEVRFLSEGERMTGFEGVVSGISPEGATLNTETMVLTSERLLERVAQRLDLIADPEFAPVAEEPGAAGEIWELVLSRLPALPPLVGGEPGGEDEAAAAPADAGSAAMRQAVGALRASMSVWIRPNSYVLVIAVVTKSPEKSAAIANAVAEIYVERQMEAKFEATRRATLWLSDQVAELQSSLELAESAVEAFLAGAPHLNEEALQAAAGRLESLRGRAQDVAVEREALREQLADAETLRRIRDFAGVAERLADPALSGIAQELAVVSGEAARALVERFDAALERRREVLQGQLATLERQAPVLQEAVADAEQRLDARGGDLIRLRQLQREAEATRALYEHFLARMKETSAQEGVHQADSEVLTWASPPGVPSSPQRGSVVLRAAVLSLALGAGLVLLLEHVNRRFRTPEEVEEFTGMPVLAIVPAVPDRAPVSYFVSRPSSAAAEAVRHLRTSLLLSNIDRPPQVVMITSSAPTEGKSTTLLMLAQVTAGMGHRTLVIESDIRRPSFRQALGLQKTAGLFAGRASREEAAEKERGRSGLLTALRGDAPIESVVETSEEFGFDILFSQRTKANAADIFASRRFAAFIEEMRERYDSIFLDTAPALLVSDARIIARVCDAVVYAVRWNSTTRQQVNSGLRLFEQANVRVSGVALTRADPRAIVKYGYEGYGAGSGGRYYLD